ncbi:tetratricopeptide repeat protein [Streptosporangium sp. NPDC050855]|uniref:nSTAND1 domain-containing NTPase n=1 Tax=Streptosporangium sp. NPDC050855 TaxID=3366194 RepID=UPI0037B83E65
MTTTASAGDRPLRPYAGLRSYDGDDHALFFGRDHEAREIATMWPATGLVVLIGAPGVGKSSLLRAGVLPRIDTRHADVLPVARVSPHRLPRPCPDGLGNAHVLALLSSWAPRRPLSELAGLTVSDFLRGHPERVDRYGDPIPVLVAIDQAEELFSGPVDQERERQELLLQLTQAAREHAGLHLLLSLREEYLAPMLPYERLLGRSSRTRFRLLPLSRAAALDAVTRPLEGTGRSFAPGAAERLVDGLGPGLLTGPDEETGTSRTVEPVRLQIACSALWDALPSSLTEITAGHVNLHLDVDAFLTGFCERIPAEVAAGSGVAVNEIRSWLRTTFVTDPNRHTTVDEGLHTTAGMPNHVVRALEDRHLLRSEQRLGFRRYGLLDDRMLSPLRRSRSSATCLADARAALAEGNRAAARDRAEEACSLETGVTSVRAEALVILGEVAARAGEVETSRRHFEEAADMFAKLQRFTGVATALGGEGRLWLGQGEYDRAVERLHTALSWAPNDVPVQLALGEALWCQGNPRSALALLNGVVALASDPPAEALALRGEIFADLDRPVEALRDLERVRPHGRPGTIAARALALALTRRFDTAGQESLDALAEDPGSGPVLLRVARVQAMLGWVPYSEELVSRALEAVSPGLPPHLRKQAEELLQERRSA